MDTTSTQDEFFVITLECEHEVYTPIKLRQQYPDDEHYILCPPCRDVKKRDVYARPPTAWQKVTKVRGVKQDALSNVREWASFILSRDILRLQPSVPRNRCRPFPYSRGT